MVAAAFLIFHMVLGRSFYYQVLIMTHMRLGPFSTRHTHMGLEHVFMLTRVSQDLGPFHCSVHCGKHRSDSEPQGSHGRFMALVLNGSSLTVPVGGSCCGSKFLTVYGLFASFGSFRRDIGDSLSFPKPNGARRLGEASHFEPVLGPCRRRIMSFPST